MVEGNGYSKLAQFLVNHRHHEKGFKQKLEDHYSQMDLVKLLSVRSDLTRTSATYALGLVGTQNVVSDLLKLLKHRDIKTRTQAEKSIWSIWFRCGNSQHEQILVSGARLIESRTLDQAEVVLTKLIGLAPDFAEAYNQRAIVHFLKGNWAQAISDCQQTINLNPSHFGAYAGIGHCYWELGHLSSAHSAYSKALELNPNLHAVAQAITQIENELENENA